MRAAHPAPAGTRWLVVGLLVLVGLAGSGCDRQSHRNVGGLTISGRAELSTTSGRLVTVTRARTVKAGEQLRMRDGTAVLSLGGGRQLELRRGSVVRLGTRTGAGGKPESRGELVSGEVLVSATGDAATVVAGDSTIQVTGVAKVSRGLAVVVGVYQGAAGVESVGRPVSVPALRQVTVSAPGLPSRATPLVFSPADSWDQRYLGDAIELGNQLAARSKGFTSQLSGGVASAVFFRQLLPKLAGQGFDQSFLAGERSPGETLVGAAIVLEGTRGQFPERWASVFGFHDDGAAWGLVALDQGVSRGPLLAAVDAAIGRLNAPGSQAAAPAVTAPSTPVVSPPPAVGGTPPGAPPTTSPAGPAAPPTTTPPLVPAPRPLNTGIPLVDDTVGAVVDVLTGLLRQLGLS